MNAKLLDNGRCQLCIVVMISVLNGIFFKYDGVVSMLSNIFGFPHTNHSTAEDSIVISTSQSFVQQVTLVKNHQCKS